jgi:3-oxoacyl-[acyl-carrier protein] reductase
VDALSDRGAFAQERDFESIKVGDSAEIEHIILQTEVDAFAALSGDFNPLHVDASFAKTTSFKKPVVHGMLSASFISTMIGMKLPGRGALWSSQTLEFLRPVYVGDRLQIQAIVKQKSGATRTLVLETNVKNQRGESVVTGTARVKVLEPSVKELTTMSSDSRVILVTGASGGIGSAVATKLAAAGHRIVVNYYKSEARAAELVQSLSARGHEALAVRCDVADGTAVDRMFREVEAGLGAVQDIVHCAAPLPEPKAFDALSWGDFQAQLDAQVKGAINCAHAGLPHMIEAGAGSIVLIGSIYSDGVPPVQQSAYVVAKAALSALARTLAVEYGPKGIRVNTVSPGMTQTEMIATVPEKAKLLAKMQAPLRRLAYAEDVADTVAFLLGSGARHISGETIRVCGGAVMV